MSAAWYCSHYLPPVSTTPVANLLPVSLIPVARRRCWHRRQICRRYHWHRWQICRCVNNTSGPGGKFVTGVNALTCEYLREFSKKFEMTLMLFSGAWEKRIHEKKTWSKKSRVPLKLTYSWNGQFFALPAHQAGICSIARAALIKFPHYFSAFFFPFPRTCVDITTLL